MTISIDEALRAGFALAKKNLSLLLLAGVVVFLIGAAPSIVRAVLSEVLGKSAAISVGILAMVVSLVVQVWLQPIMTMGLLKIHLKLIDGQSATLADLWSARYLWSKYFRASVLYFLLLLVFGLIGAIAIASLAYLTGRSLASGADVTWIGFGIIAFGIFTYILTRLQFYVYLVADKELGGRESLRRSWTMTRGHMIMLIVFGIVLALINLLGLLLLGIGLIWTLPTTSLAMAYVYRKLQDGN